MISCDDNGRQKVVYCVIVAVAVGKAVTVALGEMDVGVAGTLVAVGTAVIVYGNGVNVSGSVGTSVSPPVGVSVPNSGMIVTPGVIVATFGTHNRKPTGILFGLVMQLARWIFAVVVPYCMAIRNR